VVPQYCVPLRLEDRTRKLVTGILEMGVLMFFELLYAIVPISPKVCCGVVSIVAQELEIQCFCCFYLIACRIHDGTLWFTMNVAWFAFSIF